jgi:hypothetical protein
MSRPNFLVISLPSPKLATRHLNFPNFSLLSTFCHFSLVGFTALLKSYLWIFFRREPTGNYSFLTKFETRLFTSTSTIFVFLPLEVFLNVWIFSCYVSVSTYVQDRFFAVKVTWTLFKYRVLTYVGLYIMSVGTITYPIHSAYSYFATDWAPLGSKPGGGEVFRTRPDRPCGPPSLLYNGYRVSFRG